MQLDTDNATHFAMPLIYMGWLSMTILYNIYKFFYRGIYTMLYIRLDNVHIMLEL